MKWVVNALEDKFYFQWILVGKQLREARMTNRFMNPNGKILVPVNLDETAAINLKAAICR